jgi:hypothetical protein
VFGKFKNRAKTRSVLSAFSHMLKTVHGRTALALRLCLLSIVRDGPFDANLNTTHDTPSALSNCTDRAISSLRNRGARIIGVDCYAGDISSMFDKLPCDVVIRAVEFTLERALETRTRYRLRRSRRASITLYLDDRTASHFGAPVQSTERAVCIPFDILIAVCRHYCFHTHFEFGGTYHRLTLGIPQGGAMSDPLSKIYCVFCEHQWINSIFDHTKFSTNDGVLSARSMTDDGFRALSLLVPFPLDRNSDEPLTCPFIRRYADDCRCCAFYNVDLPGGRESAAAFIDMYKRDCYIRPCRLEDEERGSSFAFLQGTFEFGESGCSFAYVHKNGPSLETGTRKFRSLQHYTSYGQCNRTLRFSTVCGKLVEAEKFSSTPWFLVRTVLALYSEFLFLSYPRGLLLRALHKRARLPDRQHPDAWRCLTRIFPIVSSGFS